MSKRIIDFEFYNNTLSIHCFDNWTNEKYNQIYTEIMSWELKK
jgi:hypothetical protein